MAFVFLLINLLEQLVNRIRIAYQIKDLNVIKPMVNVKLIIALIKTVNLQNFVLWVSNVLL